MDLQMVVPLYTMKMALLNKSDIMIARDVHTWIRIIRIMEAQAHIRIPTITIGHGMRTEILRGLE